MSEASSGHNEISSGHKSSNLVHSERNEDGLLIIGDLDKPLIDNLSELSEGVLSLLMSLASKTHEKRRLPRDIIV